MCIRDSTPDVAYFLECFSLISRHRQSNGFGVNPLSLVDIVAVAAPLGLSLIHI